MRHQAGLFPFGQGPLGKGSEQVRVGMPFGNFRIP
jgi:hypothetical protein